MMGFVMEGQQIRSGPGRLTGVMLPGVMGECCCRVVDVVEDDVDDGQHGREGEGPPRVCPPPSLLLFPFSLFSTLSALLLLLPRRRPRPVRLWSPSPLSSFSSPLYVALALSLSHEVQRQSRLPALPPGAAKQPTKQPGKSE
jgi:hypothetical protein